jgi:eukaryotic-like serine/threonine-protein kinase
MASEPHFDGCEVAQKLRSGPATDWYLGRQRSLARAVVIKSLSPNVSPDSPFAGPLLREAQLLARLRHKNIIQLYDFVQNPRSMWLVLEHVDGFTLEECMQRAQRLPVPAALAITVQLVEALAHIHEHGVVHRDVQPRNIWISRAGEVKLTNFFLAQERTAPIPPELLEADSGFETPSYLSPEQLLSEQTDARSDLFSVGVVLYEMVSGQRPFDASDTRTTTQRIRHEPPLALSRTAPDVPASVERIIVRALQKLPADRFFDAAEMSQLLQQALSAYGSKSPQAWVKEAIHEAEAPGARDVEPARPAARQTEPTNLVRRALLVFGASGLALIGGGMLIQYTARLGEKNEAPRTSTLELLPSNPGQLLCLVRPWAHVFVDGQKVETTPFAHPIPLSAGTHYLRFEHPNAPVERRTIQIVAGERLVLDVEMQLPVKAVAAEPDLLRPPPRDAGPRSP